MPMYYYRNRYYDPTTARFISEDPIGWASGQTNAYAYVNGNPVQFSDPEGLQFVPALPYSPIPGGRAGFSIRDHDRRLEVCRSTRRRGLGSRRH